VSQQASGKNEGMWNTLNYLSQTNTCDENFVAKASLLLVIKSTNQNVYCHFNNEPNEKGQRVYFTTR
jgi:hypothetical protein